MFFKKATKNKQKQIQKQTDTRTADWMNAQTTCNIHANENTSSVNPTRHECEWLCDCWVQSEIDVETDQRNR